MIGKWSKEVRRHPRRAAFGADFDPQGWAKAKGFTPTSGWRTQAHQDALRRQGLTNTRSGSHVRRDGMDFSVPEGMTKAQAIDLFKRQYPGIRAIPSNGRSIHVTFPGWGGAPDISGSHRRYGS